MFDVVENEAQFASIVGHEIAHAVQEHTWRAQQHQKGTRTALAIGAAIAAAYGQGAISDALTLTQAAMQNGYQRGLENQSDRLGLEYMVNAGYDPREAPRVWKAMANKFGDSSTDFFWSNHDNHSTRRSYLMNELKNNYARLDYAKFQTNEQEFKRMVDRVHAATAGKRKIKVSH
jgi:predicted Zn-dependent protease